MHTRHLLVAATLCFPALVMALAPKAADSAGFSNIGLKLTLGLGTRAVPSADNLERGDAASLTLGYGVSQHVTLLLAANKSTHADRFAPDDDSDIVGVELGVQYKLRPYRALRPYGTVGLASVFLGSTGDNVLTGGGITWALGVDYRLLRFLTIGAEFFWKDMEYTKQGEDGVDGDFTKLDRPINADSRGFMLTFTLH